MRGATYQSNPALRGAQTGNQGTTLNNRLSQQTQNQNTTKPEPKPIVGTNYIKSNIANLGNIAQRRRSRMHRLDTRPAIASGDELDPSSQPLDPLDTLADRTDAIMSPSNEIGEIENQQAMDDVIGEADFSQAPYNKQIPNAAPVGPQQISARAR